MKKTIFFIGFGFVAAVLALSFGYAYRNLRGAAPALVRPPDDIEQADLLVLPPEFRIEIFAKNLPGARVMAMDATGNIWVSRTRDDALTFLKIENGVVAEQKDVFADFGLTRPHGLVFDPQDSSVLYIADETRILKTQVNDDGAGETYEVVAKLPDKGGARGHYTRTIAFGPDDRLYVSVGSSCNVCREDDPRRAAILSMKRDGSDERLHARGLRNSVFFTWSFVDGRMFATEMGRDGLGDDVPPDEINIIEEGKDYGWPLCYGRGVHGNPCNTTEPPFISLGAHVAPLGLAFIPEEGWPENYWYDLVVAYHGSWNRSEPVGYKVARFPLDAQGRYDGVAATTVPQEEDFIAGWLTPEGDALGRPVDILVRPGGVMYVSDDKAGVIYKVSYLIASI